MLARPVIFGSVTLIDPVLPSTCKSAPCQANKPGQGDDEGGHDEAAEQEALGAADRGADRDRGGDRQVRVPAVFDVQHGHHRGGEAADTAPTERSISPSSST